MPLLPASPRRFTVSRSTGVILCASALVLVLGGSACLPGAPSTTTVLADSGGKNTPRIGKAVRGDLSGVLSFTGEVRAKGRIPIVPRVTAPLDRLYVDVGSRVREGEPLADLNRSELEAQVLQAQAAQAAAEARLATLKAGARPEALAQAQANLKAAQARVQAVEAARANAQDAATLQKQLDQARAKLRSLEGAQPASATAVADADAALTAARTRLNQVLQDAARSNDRNAVEVARQEVSRAEAAATAARASASTQGAVESARLEVQDAQQALAFARLSPSAFDLDQGRALVEAADAQVKLVSAPASPDEIKAAEAAVEQAYAVAELARTRLRDASITAPIAGVVTELNAAAGSTVGPTGAILTLIPPELVVEVQADETQAAGLEVGQTARLTLESLPQDAFDGTVKAIAPVLDPRTRTVGIKVEVPDPRGKLRPGMFAQVAIQTSQRQAAIMVPREAVIKQAGPESVVPQTVVYLVVDNRVKRQRVTVGASDAKNIEVLQGLSEGMDVILAPRADLIDGELVPGK